MAREPTLSQRYRCLRDPDRCRQEYPSQIKGSHHLVCSYGENALFLLSEKLTLRPKHPRDSLLQRRDSFSDRVFGQFSHPVQAEFLLEILAMVAHSFLAHHELIGYLHGRSSLGDKL